MKCLYINLDSAGDRRARFEANWAANCGADWRLERFAALDTRYVEQHAVDGTLRPAEKACFLSHCSSIALNMNATEPLFVMEDDAVLGPHSAPTIDNFLRVSDNYDWDIVFTEVGIVSPSTMLDLIKLRQELTGKDEVRLLDLAKLPFGGATGYIINHRSLKKIGALLGVHEELHIPYDLLLRKLIYEKKLKGLVFSPSSARSPAPRRPTFAWRARPTGSGRRFASLPGWTGTSTRCGLRSNGSARNGATRRAGCLASCWQDRCLLRL